MKRLREEDKAATSKEEHDIFAPLPGESQEPRCSDCKNRDWPCGDCIQRSCVQRDTERRLAEPQKVLHYNRNVIENTYFYGKQKPVPCKVRIPDVGCILVEMDNGYGSGRVEPQVVLMHQYGKNKRITAIQVATVIRIDIGKGAECLPDAPGQLSYATNSPVWLKLFYRPSEGEATYAASNHTNSFYILGEYRPRDVGFDK